MRGARCSSWSASSGWARPEQRFPVLRFVPGIDWDRFETTSRDAIRQELFLVAPESDRMGVRLRGPELKRHSSDELISQAVAPGALQVPASGEPILLLGDCGTIGGYPKIAHVIGADLPIAAQLRAGDQLRFAETTVQEAHRLLAAQERDLNLFRVGLSEMDRAARTR
jgi:antagonist of KipI